MTKLLEMLAFACALLVFLAFTWAPVAEVLPWAGWVVAVALALTFLALLVAQDPPRRLAAWVVGGLALALSGCGTLVGAGLPDAEKTGVTKQFMENYAERCKGHFWGNIGMGGTTGFDINCAPPQDDKSVEAIVAGILSKLQAASAATPLPDDR